MPAGIRYKPDYEGLGQVMRSQEMAAMLHHKAEEGRQYAEAIADSFRRTGEYASSFSVSSSERGSGRYTDRAEARLTNSSGHALLVEYQDDYRVLGTVVDIIEGGL